MGMAASQARYLELTARKTDVEYAGQQINQQRTALSNESAGLFTQLMGLSVPTAPSSSDYTTTSYTYNDGSNDCTINSDDIKTLTGDVSNNSTVTYSYPETNYTGIDKTRTDLTVSEITSTNGTETTSSYWIGSTKLTTTNTTGTTSGTTTTDTSALTQIETDCADSEVAKIYAGTESGTIYKYTSGGTTYYVASTELDSILNAGTSTTSASGVTTKTGTGTLDTCYGADITTSISTTEKAYVTYSSTGRASSIALASISGTTFDLTASTTTNTNAYNDAVNDYEYQQEIYQQQVTAINAKTSIIEAEDKTLELKLTQLDTEQQALSTEMDSVKKVVDKNIEQTFKTFSS